MPQHTIDLIGNDKPWETEINMRKVIEWWLRQGDASWSELADALQKMGRVKLAERIQHNHPEVSITILPHL